MEGRNSASFSKTWSHECCCVPINLEAEAMAITTGGANMKLRTRRPTPWSRLPTLSHKPGHLYVFASTGNGEFDYQDCRETQECIEAILYDLYCFKPRQEWKGQVGGDKDKIYQVLKWMATTHSMSGQRSTCDVQGEDQGADRQTAWREELHRITS